MRRQISTTIYSNLTIWARTGFRTPPRTIADLTAVFLPRLVEAA